VPSALLHANDVNQLLGLQLRDVKLCEVFYLQEFQMLSVLQMAKVLDLLVHLEPRVNSHLDVSLQLPRIVQQGMGKVVQVE
jgi:hypothetical protein